MARKSPLQLEQPAVTDAEYVAQASKWTRAMLARETRGPGDLENAMLRLEARYGIPFSTLWSLRYRAPKGLLSGAFARIGAAYRAECERQMRLLQDELEETKEVAGTDANSVRSAMALVDTKDS